MLRNAALFDSEILARRCLPSTVSCFYRGIQTLALRVERHVENARKVADFQRNHPNVEWVNYVGFPDNPLYPTAHRYLDSNFWSLLTFGVKGGY
jgi:O-acetylhomoserine (thiol)-lyase